MCSRQKAWCLQGADHFCINLCRGHGLQEKHDAAWPCGVDQIEIKIWHSVIWECFHNVSNHILHDYCPLLWDFKYISYFITPKSNFKTNTFRKKGVLVWHIEYFFYQVAFINKVLFLHTKLGVISRLVGLDLFNDDTCPSGHISRPTQVNVSQELLSFSKKLSYTGKCVSELLSFSKQLLKSDHIVHVWELVEVNKLHHIR